MKRFELVEGTSSKFWEVSVEGKTLTVRFGRIGTEGQAKQKDFVSNEKALAEQDKLIREKTGKGYVAAGARSNKAAASSKATSAKSAAAVSAAVKPTANSKKSAGQEKQAPAVKPAAKGGKGAAGQAAAAGPTRDKRGFETWTAEDLARFERGFPHLVELVEGHPHDKQVKKRLAATASGVDQIYDVEWPSQVARAYAHIFGTLGDQSPSVVEKLVLEWTPPDAAPTAATLKKMLKDCMPGGSTYAGWKAPPAFYIMEHFLGSEVVALAIIERLAGYTKAQWDADLYGDDDHARIAGDVLGYLMLRCDGAARKRVQAALDALLAKRPTKAKRTERLRGCFEKVEQTRESWDGKFGLNYLDARTFYLDGCDHLLSVPLQGKFANIREFSKRIMLEWVDHLGRIKHPGVVRVIVAFGAFRAAAPAVKAWMDAHADYVAEMLPRFADDPAVQKGLEALGAAAATPSKKGAKKKQLGGFETAEKVFAELEKALPKAFPDQKKVTALIQAGVDECREAARSEGETYMEVHFVNLWAEGFEFDCTKEEFALLSKAYEDVVIDG